jgi:hypothetical protein
MQLAANRMLSLSHATRDASRAWWVVVFVSLVCSLIIFRQQILQDLEESSSV